MKKVVKKKLIDCYSDLLTKHGYSQQSLAWGSRKGKQSVRFEVLCQVGNLTNTTILDVGCGFGDLYGYLKYRNIKTKYLGIDINEELLKIGRKTYPGIKLELRDIEEKKFMRKFDWVFASGIAAIGVNYASIRDILTEMFKICKKGVAMNFVSDFVDYKDKGLFYSSPEKIYSILRLLSNRVIIRHDYMPYEFTVYAYKNNKKTPNNVFEEFLSNSQVRLDDSLWRKNS